MKQIAIISGKGGSGKTTVSSSLASIIPQPVICDCDVEAPNLHLLLKPEKLEEGNFYGLPKAFINQDKCIQCNKCIKFCRFEAINSDYQVVKADCEGCTVCAHVCPVTAVEMVPNQAGTYFKSATKYGTLFHAELNIGEKNSGKLVALLREKALEEAYNQKAQFIVIDGPPGIGCPTIATLSGVDLAVIVVEPTVSAVHDMMRTVELCQHFKTKYGFIINKRDLNPSKVEKIRAYALQNNIPLLGELPFDPVFRKAVKSFTVPAQFSPAIREDFRLIWSNIENMLSQSKQKGDRL